MSTKISAETQNRLMSTECGRPLLQILERFGDYPSIARAAGVDNQAVRVWFYKGKISVRNAIKLAEVMGVPKETLRPDLMPEEWNYEPRGPIPGHKAVVEAEDAKLLVALAKQYGSVRSLCEAVDIKVTSYHCWKSRGRIPAAKLPEFLALRK